MAVALAIAAAPLLPATLFVVAPLAAQSTDPGTLPVPARGPEDAVLRIVVFSDFQCPFCAQAVPVLEALLTGHPDDVRLEYRHFPLPMHEHAARAAQASLEAQRQGAFWPYHDLLFAHQDALTDPDLVGYADSLDLDATAFERALAEGTHQARMHWDMAEGMARGITGTPTFFLNGFRLQGVPPLWVFELALEAFRDGLVEPARGEPADPGT